MSGTSRLSARHRRLAAGVALIVIVVVAFLAQSESEEDSSREQAVAESADATIERMLAHARDGDVEAWLACFSGTARTQREARLEITGREQFSGQLQADAESLKSFAASDWRLSGSEAVLHLEKVFADRSEKWRITLQESGSVWVIVKETRLDEFAPDIPYGTQVSPEPD